MLYIRIRLKKVILFTAVLFLLTSGIAMAKQITLSGRLYYGPSNDRTPIRYARVEVWDDWGLYPLASTQTDSEGRFTIKYENNAPGDGLDQRIDPKLKVICRNEGVNVQGPGVINYIIPGPLNLIPGLTDWSFTTEVIETGLNQNLSNLVYVAPSDRWPAFASFSAMSDVYYKLRSVLKVSPTPERVIAIWPSAVSLANDLKHMFEGNIGQGASAAIFVIFLSQEGASYPNEAQHEYGHALMHYAYFPDLFYFSSSEPNNPEWDFVEGWAEFIPRWARDSDYTENSIGSSHCESGGGFDTTNVLWDLVDSAQSKDESPNHDDDPISDQSQQTFKKIWTILSQDKPHNLADFWNAWKRRYPALAWEVKCCLVNNNTKWVTIKNNQPKVSDIKINGKTINSGDIHSGVLTISATVEDEDEMDIPHLKAYFFVNFPSSPRSWYCLGVDNSISNKNATITWDTRRSWRPVYPYTSGQGYYGGGGRIDPISKDFPGITSGEGIKLRVLVTDGMPWDLGSSNSFIDSQPFNIINTTSSIISPQTGVSTFNLPRQFSSVQGGNNWYYYIGTPSRFHNAIFDNIVAPWGTLNNYSWNGGAGYSGPRYLQITGRDLNDWRNPGVGGWLLPGEGSDVMLGWKAERHGTVYISAMLNTYWVDATSISSRDDGILFSIWKGNQRIIEESRVFRGNNESNRIPYVLKKATVNVIPGDMIYFYIRRGNWQDCDEMYYSFTISYDSNADLDHPHSTHSISGREVTLSARDDQSEISSIEYAFHDKNTNSWLAWSRYEKPFTLPANVDRFIYRAIDSVGNLEPYHIVLVEK